MNMPLKNTALFFMFSNQCVCKKAILIFYDNSPATNCGAIPNIIVSMAAT